MKRWLSILKGLALGGVAVLTPRAFAGEPRALVVVIYDGWGTPTAFSLAGRGLGGPGVRAPVGGASYPATTDADGVFTLMVKGLPAKAALPAGEVHTPSASVVAV